MNEITIVQDIYYTFLVTLKIGCEKRHDKVIFAKKFEKKTTFLFSAKEDLYFHSLFHTRHKAKKNFPLYFCHWGLLLAVFLYILPN